ncbi:hypothetical protein BCR42DRAFT_398279 [Absidia repens]|uniref:Uncharacterized protein n=1 Tax=Absidia repens TaxID=90262 RepID=A0A1X2HYN4_9FUNG|nr:hypothetical protein BCR42DRAFT_398279 [Absidia repens]
MPTSMHISVVLFVVLWILAMVAAQDSDPNIEVDIIYGNPSPYPTFPLTTSEETFLFGACIPSIHPKTGHIVHEGEAVMPAICSQYQLENCKGNVLDSKFDLQKELKRIPVNYEKSKSFVCIPLAPK